MWTRLRQHPLDLYILYRSCALTWAFMPFQVYYLESRGLTLSAIFDLNVVFSLATVALEVPTGIFADRYGRRIAMAAGGGVMVAAMACFLAGVTFPAFALANVLCALSMTLASGADSAYLYDHLADQHRAALYARYEGLATAAKGIGNLVAVLLGGAIYSVSPRGVFVFTAVITGAAGVLALLLPERRHPVRDGSAVQDLQRAVRVVVADGRIIATLAFGAVTFVLLRISLFADQPHLEAHLPGITAAQLAFAAALLAGAKEIGGALLASASGGIVQKFGARIIVPVLAVFIVACYATMSYGNGAIDIVTMVLLSSAFGLFSPLMRAILNRLIPGPRDRATLLSFESMGRRVLFAAASPLFGRAVEASSLHAAFFGTAWTALAVYLLLGVSALYAVVPRLSIAARQSIATPNAPASVAG